MGELVPIGCYEVLPGDTVQQMTAALVRVSPLLTPVMHPVHVRIHHWYVPYRIIWEDFETFITGGPDGEDASAYPTFTATTITEGTLDDYLGVPPGNYAGISGLQFSALPHRAYNLIYNEWYRDQDLSPEAALSTASGADATTARTLRKAAWEKDRFTSARPWTQKGPEVVVPIGDTAPVVSDGTNVSVVASGLTGTLGVAGSQATKQVHQVGAVADSNTMQWVNTGMEADLSAATGVSINDLREAFALQRYEEARARYGSRYVEYLRYLGVRPSDGRLQLPEYLGGGRQTISFSEVLQTAPDTEADPEIGVGNLRGHGMGALRSNRFRRFIPEHGVVLTLMSVLPKTMYTQGLARMWNRRTKEDFWQKELQHIGQEEIAKKEIYANQASNGDMWAFQDRYDDYRHHESTVSGEFRSTLNMWHYAREFSSAPALDASFVESTPTKRVNAVQTNDVLWVMARHSIQARRMVARTGKSFIY